MPSASDPLSPPEAVSDEEVDRLFSLPLDEFVRSRDELAKELRKQDRAAGAWVKGLRKPSVAAWATNQLIRAQPKKAKRLLQTADALRGAQEELAQGSGDGAELRRRAEEEREAVSALIQEVQTLKEGGLGEAVLDRIRDTLHAVAMDREARQLVEKGYLTQELHATGFGPFIPEAAGHEQRPRGNRRAERPRTDQKERAKAKEELGAAQKEAKERKRLLQHTRRDLRQATKERDRAERRHDEAAASEHQADRDLDEAEKRVRKLEKRLKARAAERR